MDEPSPPLSVLRPALELAWLVARTGSQARPPERVPGPLRPLLGAAKLPNRMLATVQKVVEEDDEFRQRVAHLADESVLGRGAWLWLVRPDGWREELAELAAAASTAESEAEGRQAARQIRRRLEEATGALARAEADLALLRHRDIELTEQVEDERQARRESENLARAAEVALRSARNEIAGLQESTAALEAQVEQLSGDVASTAALEAATAAARDLARGSVARLEAELADAGTETARIDEQTKRARAGVGEALGRAAAAAHDLGEALLAATRSLGVEGAPGATQPPSGATTPNDFGSADPSSGPEADGRTVPRSGSGGRDRGAGGAAVESPLALRGAHRRVPIPLPPALFDDSVEVAGYLVRVGGVLLVVDGYNVTLTSWPGLELPVQRRRLVDALAELVMRAGTSVHLVFDGVAEGNRLQPPAAVRRRMHVEFSPSEVEADDVIIATVDRLDPNRPVVVATNDRRVQQAVLDRGANVISVDQLLGVLGRVRTAG